SDADAAIVLYKRAFGARLLARVPTGSENKIIHACIAIGDSRIFVAEGDSIAMQPPRYDDAGSTRLYIYVEDVDAMHARAVSAGMKQLSAPAGTFWGDRMSAVVDEFGHTWALA